MKNLINRAKYVMGGEDGASNLEAVVWIFIVLIITVALIVFGGKIKEFLTSASGEVSNMDTQIKGTTSP